jgi:hypothetical protein
LRAAAETPVETPDVLFAVFNGGSEVPLVLPDHATGWQLILDTTAPDAPVTPVSGKQIAPAQSVLVFAPT